MRLNYVHGIWYQVRLQPDSSDPALYTNFSTM